MNNKKWVYPCFTCLIALVWLINGLYCKLMGGTPRHQAIVAEIVSSTYSYELIKAIGAAEVIMAVWALTGWKHRWAAATQIGVVATMNCLEFALVPHLLLFGKVNALFAFLFIVAVYVHAFVFPKKLIRQPYLWSPS